MTEIYLNDNLKNSLILLSRSKEVNINTVIIAAFNTIIQRYSSQEDITFEQSLISEQYLKDVGDKLEVQNLKTPVNNKIEFTDFLKTQQKSIDESKSFRNIKYPIANNSTADEKIELLKTLFVVQDAGYSSTDHYQFEIDNGTKELLIQFNLFDIGLFLKDAADFPKLYLFNNPNTVDDNLYETFKQHFVNVLNAIAEKPDAEIGSYNILSPGEFDLIVNKFNETATYYNKNQTIHALFENQVKQSPDSVALIMGLKIITYGQLNKSANQLARYLIKKGLKTEDKVGLIVTRDFSMIIGMLAILKAGGSYVPIDNDYPAERQQYLFNHSQATMVIADDDYQLKSMIGDSSYIRIDSNEYDSIDDTDLQIDINPEQLAYIIYTSGSTGTPKGVMIAHHSVINLVSWVNNTFKVGSDDRLLFITSMCFDLSVYDIFGMLAAGGTLVIAKKEEIQNVRALQDMIVKYNITFWDSVPTTLDYLIKNVETERLDYQATSLKTIFLSGDWIPKDLPERTKNIFPKAQFVSLGGATEGTVWSNFYIVSKTLKTWNSIPYGKPIDNNFFYILNEHLQPLPVGVTGDLYIGGVGVAKGYANDPMKSAASFIPDPFNKEAGGVMYKTGDLGKMMPDFNMEFIGRKDNQVKISGFRIELGEIESVLKNYPFIENSVVLAKNDSSNNKRLISYFTTRGEKFNQDDLLCYLKEKLPNYMIPAIWVELDTLPLTDNGKIDRKTLANLDDSALLKKPSSAQPNTITEKIIFNIWKDLLKLNVSGVNDNFFELGGHSLMAVQMLTRFKKVTGKSFQLGVLYQYPEISTLAQFIDSAQNEDEFKYLVSIKAKGTKDPLYIIQGDSGNILNFSNLIKHIDKEQPLYGLKAIGLDGIYGKFENLSDIADLYIQEIIKHNPVGPYFIAGYSSGAYIAVEVRKQLAKLGKQVKPIIIIDADAGMTEYKKKYKLLPKKIKRHYPRIFNYLKSSLSQLGNKKDDLATSVHQVSLFKQQLSKEDKRVKNKRERAFRNYEIQPFDDKIYLLKAKISVHYVDYGDLLGWEKYAKDGVKLCEVKGDHFSILLPPYVEEFTASLQKHLNES
jgi:amino acid adenylation domain-containing protein